MESHQSFESALSSLGESIPDMPDWRNNASDEIRPPTPVPIIYEPPSPKKLHKSPSSSVLLETASSYLSAGFVSNWGTQSRLEIEEFSDLADEPHDPIFQFKNDVKARRRRQLCDKIRGQYPSRVPVIVALQKRRSCLFRLSKEKYLVPDDMTMGAFIHETRKHIEGEFRPSTSLFAFVGSGVLPPMSYTVNAMWEKHRDVEDGFLYITLTEENVFGECV